MTDLNSMVQIVLREGGYDTWPISYENTLAVGFEDQTSFGFACVFANVTELLHRWNATEMSLLTHHTNLLQMAGEKTWNVYMLFLCTESPTQDQMKEVQWIEENLERTRKITGCGLKSKPDLVTALLPLLPFQHQPLLTKEDFDLTQRLTKRIAEIAPAAKEVVLDRTVTAIEVVRLLGAES